MEQMARHEQEQEARLYAYIRRGEWGFGRYNCIGAEIPNLAVKAWAEGKLADDDLTDIIIASYRAKRVYIDENPWYEEFPTECMDEFRLQIYRAYKYLVGTYDEWEWVTV